MEAIKPTSLFFLSSRFSSRMFLYLATFICSSVVTSHSVPLTEHHHNAIFTQCCFTISGDDISQMMCSAWLCQTYYFATFCQSPLTAIYLLHSSFYPATMPGMQNQKYCRDGCLPTRFSYQCAGLSELFYSDCWVPSYLSDWDSPCQAGNSRKVQGFSKIFQFQYRCGHYSVRAFNALESVYIRVLHGLMFVLTMHCVVCAFPNSIQFTFAAILQSSFRHIPRIIKANRMQLTTI